MSWLKFDAGVGIVLLSSMIVVARLWEDGPWWRRQFKRWVELTVQSAQMSVRYGALLHQYLQEADWLESMREPRKDGIVVPIKGWKND